MEVPTRWGREGVTMRLTLYVNGVGASIMWSLCDADTPGAFLSIDANWRSSRGQRRSGVYVFHTADGGVVRCVLVVRRGVA